MAFLVWMTGNAKALVYEISGALEIKIYHQGNLRLSNNYDFKVCISNALFSLRTIHSSGAISDCVFNGAELRYLLSGNRAQHSPAGTVSQSPASTNPHHSASVETNAVPFSSGSYLSLLWLAYASKSYLASNSVIEPVWVLDDFGLRNEGFTMSFAVAQSPGSGGRLESLYFLADGIYRGYDDNHRKPLRLNYPAPYDRGFTNAIFRWLSYTNLSNEHVPASFSFTRYSYPIDGKPPYELEIAAGQANELRLISNAVNMDLFSPGVTTVWDRRFKGELNFQSTNKVSYPAAVYNVTNSHWLYGAELTNAVRQYETNLIIKQLHLQSKLDKDTHFR